MLAPSTDTKFLSRMQPPESQLYGLDANGQVVTDDLLPFRDRWNETVPALDDHYQNELIKQCAVPLQALALSVDNYLNNTSLSLLLQYRGKTLLFPATGNGAMDVVGAGLGVDPRRHQLLQGRPPRQPQRHTARRTRPDERQRRGCHGFHRHRRLLQPRPLPGAVFELVDSVRNRSGPLRAERRAGQGESTIKGGQQGNRKVVRYEL